MMNFLIKSTICLVILYGFYHIFLQHQKMLLFNRFYLISSLVISIFIPLIVVPVKSNFLFNPSFDRLSIATGRFLLHEAETKNTSTLFNFQNILTIIFIIISSIMFIRFALNIFRIVRKILKSRKVDNLKTSLVLIEEKILPYSFFKYIFVNQSDYESGKIEKELLIHEEAHCSQYHSIDIILIELLNVFLWFNPAIWFFRKAILLNHEYYADNKVLINKDPIDYQQLLLNILLRNSSNYLVSNFKNSLIKNRLIMMTKSNSLHYAIIRKISAISLFLILAITLTFCEKINKPDNEISFEKEWWFPILKRHNIEPVRFNTFETVFEMGTTNSINNRIVTLENAFFLVRSDSDRYVIIKSTLAYHDLDKNVIEGENVTMDEYRFNSSDHNPFLTTSARNATIHLRKGKYVGDLNDL
jgi:bla regulator protein blaR1